MCHLDKSHSFKNICDPSKVKHFSIVLCCVMLQCLRAVKYEHQRDIVVEMRFVLLFE